MYEYTCIIQHFNLLNQCSKEHKRCGTERVLIVVSCFLGPGIPLSCIPGNPAFSSSPPNPLGLPCSGTTVFPLPGSFPWTAGNRGKVAATSN